ncbi:MAG: (2Fe-2S)-binding protein [Candidatus Thermoplasmatota archaeon]|nr:(2Fe-2S)-binding protein [Candidatus Thermoplasmatota archaeon]
MDAIIQEIRFTLNGHLITMLVDTRETLLDAIRDHAGLTGAKKGCDEAACGACSMLLNGKSICSCNMLAVEAAGEEIVTIEGISKENIPSEIQKAFIENDAFQCGFCTAGQIISATSLLASAGRETLTKDQVREGMSGNVCRCGAYAKILEAVSQASRGGK